MCGIRRVVADLREAALETCGDEVQRGGRGPTGDRWHFTLARLQTDGAAHVRGHLGGYEWSQVATPSG
eukprot:scaffold4126_cov383-Prasinococcus_capsulatus_cf.AAC.5